MFKKLNDRVIIEFGTKSSRLDFDKADQNNEGILITPEFTVSYASREVTEFNGKTKITGEIESDLTRTFNNLGETLAYAAYLASGDELDDLNDINKEYKNLLSDNVKMQTLETYLNMLCFAMRGCKDGQLRLVIENTEKAGYTMFFEMPFSDKVYKVFDPWYYESGLRQKLLGADIRSPQCDRRPIGGLIPGGLTFLDFIPKLIDQAKVETGLFIVPFKDALTEIQDYINRINAYSALTERDIEAIYKRLEKMGNPATDPKEGKKLTLRPALSTIEGHGDVCVFLNDDCTAASLATANISSLKSSLGLKTYYKKPILTSL